MRGIDLADLVALAAEVSEVDAPKLPELLDTDGVEAVLAEARAPLLAHEAAARILAGIVALDPLPVGNRRLAVLAAARLLAVNGLGADLDPLATRDLLAGVAAGREDVASVTVWLDPLVSALDPLEGELRRLLSADAWRAIGLAVLRSSRHGRHEATPGDLFMGLFREGTGPAAVALGCGGPGMDETAYPPRPHAPGGVPAFSAETRKVLELAFRVAAGHGHREISGGHLLVGMLDGGHEAVLGDGLDAVEIRQRTLDLLPPGDGGDIATRLHHLVTRLRSVDPEAAAEVEEIADQQRIGLDRIVGMVRAWRGDIFLEALAGEPVVSRLLGADRLGRDASDTLEQRLLAKYLGDISIPTQLTRDEEVALAESIRADSTACSAPEARRRLVEASLPLVVSIARKYETSGLTLLELIQAGNLGLMQAAERFDPAKGFRFRTFATWWVRRSVLDAIERRPG